MTDTYQVSDGFHTFGELYEHRSVLFIALMGTRPGWSWFSKAHADGSMFPGFFIAGMDLPTGEVSYHLRVDPWWSLVWETGALELDQAPAWDGYTPRDVPVRL